MKNLITLLFLVLLLVSFSACAGNNEGNGFDLQFGLGPVYAEDFRNGKPWNERNMGTSQYFKAGTLWKKNAEYYFQFGIGSVHAEKRQDGKPWNEANSGVAFQYITTGMLWNSDVEYCTTVGTIKNSEFGQTSYAGSCVRKKVLHNSAGTFSIGAFVGLMTYPSVYNELRRSNQLFPVVLPVASVCLKSGKCLDMTYIPKVPGKTATSAVLFMGRFPI